MLLGKERREEIESRKYKKQERFTKEQRNRSNMIVGGILCFLFPPVGLWVLYNTRMRRIDNREEAKPETKENVKSEKTKVLADTSNHKKINQVGKPAATHLKKSNKFIRILKMTFATIGILIILQIIATITGNLMFGDESRKIVGIFGAVTLLLSVGFIIYRFIVIIKKD